jgi:hypothetical protein
MKNITYLVLDMFDQGNYYTVSDLNELVNEMYECELLEGKDLETVKGWFFNNHKVFEIKGEYKELTSI